ncbi:MAG: S8 family serine peptidase [Bacteroidia bacterium]|nr:S8 family serine peptidase [Bacteroidia bacterium]
MNIWIKLWLFGALEVFAQGEKRWIFFADKGPDWAAAAPETFLSRASLERRAVQGLSLDFSDYPVCKRYLDELRARGVRINRVSRWLNAASGWAEDWNEIEKLPFVAGLRPVGVLRAAGDDSLDPLYGAAAAQIRMLELDVLHAAGLTGKSVLVAVFDDGFRNVNTLPGFAHLFKRGAVKGAYDFVGDDQDVYSDGGHGTNCFSIMAVYDPGKFVGSSHEADFWLFRTEDASSETLREEDNWVAAAEKADSAGAQVFQTSLGYHKFDNDVGNHQYSDLNGKTAPISKAADAAGAKGIVVVNSAGNEGAGAWRYITPPADAEHVLAVGSVDENRNISPFSGRGPTADGRVKPDICALGGMTVHLNIAGQYARGFGTSYAAPLIAGMAACLRQAFPSAKAQDIFNAIKASGDRASRPDNDYGHGVANAPKAYLLLAMQYPQALVQNLAGLEVRPDPETGTLTLQSNTKVRATLVLGGQKRKFVVLGEKQIDLKALPGATRATAYKISVKSRSASAQAFGVFVPPSYLAYSSDDVK